MELELYKEDILKIGEYIVSIEGNVEITVDANDNSLGLKEIMMFSRETPAFRRWMKAPAFAFIIQRFSVYLNYVDIQVQTLQCHKCGIV